MITGVVSADYEAVIRLLVQGPAGQEREVDAVIDTGFNGFLTLPPVLVTALGLPRLSRGRAILANGSEDLFDIYGATVLWDGQPRYIETDARLGGFDGVVSRLLTPEGVLLTPGCPPFHEPVYPESVL